MTMTAPARCRYEFVVTAEDAGGGAARLDAWLAGRPALADAGFSRSRLQSLAHSGAVAVNGAAARPSRRIRPGDVVVVAPPLPVAPAGLTPQNIPLSLLYEDDDIAVVDKPAGLPVHPGPGHPDGTLVNALLHRCPDLAGVGGELRPGIVHRLDRDTSGLLVVAKNQAAHQSLTEQLRARAMLKEYLAVAAAASVAPEAGVIDAPIGRHPWHRQKMAVVAGGRAARTGYATAERLPPGHTLLRLRLETGRTHQIRVHLAHRGWPVLGDPVYGRPSGLLWRQFLHAARLGFWHPATGRWQEYCAGLPADLAGALDALRGESV